MTNDEITIRVNVDTTDAIKALDELALRAVEVQQTHGVLTELVVPQRKTGVIVGALPSMSYTQANAIERQLAERFPEVRFAVVAGTSSVSFEWDEDES